MTNRLITNRWMMNRLIQKRLFQKRLFQKRLVMFLILVISLLSISCVYASDNLPQDLSSMADGDYHIRIEDGNVVLCEEYDAVPVPVDASGARIPGEAMEVDIPDGEYSIEFNMAGGSGKASIASPTLLTVRDGKAYAHLVWSSANYDYMIVAGEKLMNQSEEGANSSYDIPVLCMDSEMPVIADTLAMGTPHEVNYTLTFFSESVGAKSALPQEAAKRVILIALLIIIGGGILNRYVNKRSYQ